MLCRWNLCWFIMKLYCLEQKIILRIKFYLNNNVKRCLKAEIYVLARAKKLIWHYFSSHFSILFYIISLSSFSRFITYDYWDNKNSALPEDYWRQVWTLLLSVQLLKHFPHHSGPKWFYLTLSSHIQWYSLKCTERYRIILK